MTCSAVRTCRSSLQPFWRRALLIGQGCSGYAPTHGLTPLPANDVALAVGLRWSGCDAQARASFVLGADHDGHVVVQGHEQAKQAIQRIAPETPAQ